MSKSKENKIKNNSIDGDSSECVDKSDDKQREPCVLFQKLNDKDAIAMTCIELAQLRFTVQDSVNMDSIIREIIDNLIEVSSSDLTELYNIFIYPNLGPIKNVGSISKFFDVWYTDYLNSIHGVIKTIVEDDWYKLVCNKPGTIQTRDVIR